MRKRISMRIAKPIIEQVLGQLTYQMNVLQELVQAPIQAMISDVVGGIWVGEGANNFIEECTNLFIPSIQQVHSSVGIIGNNINHALDEMNEADDKAKNIVDDLAEVFSTII